jgi:hypothetical protein
LGFAVTGCSLLALVVRFSPEAETEARKESHAAPAFDPGLAVATS